MTRKKSPASGDISVNRKARQHYEILEKFEAGVELKGTEVKAIRLGLANLSNAFAKIENGQLFLYGLDIQPYEKASFEQHEPKRPRRLLVHKREIDRLFGQTTVKGLSIVATRIYWKGSRIKVEVCVGRGKEKGDRREDLKARTAARETEREVSRFNRR